MTRAVIFANGEVGDPEAVEDLLRADDILIAADGGLTHVLRAGLTPAAIVGDLDSSPRELVQLAVSRGAELQQHPRRKESTDLELAIEAGRQRGADEVLILGAFGGRIDHALANVLLLARPAWSDMSLKLAYPGADIQIARPGRTTIIDGERNGLVTLLPMAGDAEGVTTEGLEYALRDGSLLQGSSRGVSNLMTEAQATVTVRVGILLVIHVEAEPEPQ